MTDHPSEDRFEAKLTDEFILAYGHALIQWAQVEQQLFFWFELLTQMGHSMARAIFYSARSFTGRYEMMEGAIAKAKTSDEARAFIASALDKAVKYNSFRNRLAHGEMVLITESPEPIKAILTQGRDFISLTREDIDLAQLYNAEKNFVGLSQLLILGMIDVKQIRHPKRKPLSECLALVDELPNEAGSATLSQKQRGRLRQRRSALASAQRKAKPPSP